jgi:hypothetical protein
VRASSGVVRGGPAGGDRECPACSALEWQVDDTPCSSASSKRCAFSSR